MFRQHAMTCGAQFMYIVKGVNLGVITLFWSFSHTVRGSYIQEAGSDRPQSPSQWSLNSDFGLVFTAQLIFALLLEILLIRYRCSFGFVGGQRSRWLWPSCALFSWTWCLRKAFRIFFKFGTNVPYGEPYPFQWTSWDFVLEILWMVVNWDEEFIDPVWFVSWVTHMIR